MNHRQIIGRLCDCDHVSAVSLVGRATLPIACSGTYLLVPDLHLLSAERRGKFAYSFDHDKGWSSDGGTYREPLLNEVLEAFLSDTSVRILQLGDLFDMWREQMSGTASAQAICSDHPQVTTRLLNPAVKRVLGNHDHIDGDTANPGAVLAMLLENDSILVTHGDVFDPTEELPDALNAAGVNSEIGRLLGSRDVDLRGAVLVQQESDVRDVVAASHHLAPAVGIMVEQLRRGNPRACGRLGLPVREHDVRAVVIGHTHQARVVRKQSGTLLMDCGGWIERCTVAPASPPEPSAQIGVIAATDGKADFRVYQLTVR